MKLEGDSQENELARAQWGQTYLGDHPSGVDVGLGHGGLLATDSKGLVLSSPDQGACLPLVHQQVLNGEANIHPQSGAVWLEEGPLKSRLNGLLNEDHEPTNGNKKPFRIQAGGTCAPDQDPIARKVANDIDAPGIEQLTLSVAKVCRKPYYSSQRRAGARRSSVHAMLDRKSTRLNSS